jgi:glutamine synthetase
MIDRKDPARDEIVQSVLSQIKKNEIKFAWLNFLDINGIMKSYGVRAARLEDILESGEGFDGSSINGYGVLEESDMVGLPDPSTFAVIPWRDQGSAVARFICDIYNPDESRYEGDPRFILKRQVEKAKSIGYEYICAPELEFFWLKEGTLGGAPTETDMRGYFDADPHDENQIMRRKLAEYASAFPGLIVDTVHHEVAKSQHEVDIQYGPAIDIADAATTLKMLVKVVGAEFGCVGTFMAKPFFGHNGSGMHVHQSLWKDGNNMFFDAKGQNQISSLMKNFIAGQLNRAKEMMAVLNSWPNSYNRLVPGYEAPTLCAWGFKNRSSQIRVPNFFNKSKAARCEIRSPDGSGNLYLQLSVLIAAGLEGIEKKMNPPAPIDLNLFHLSEDELKEKGVKNLPGYFHLALEAMQESTWIKEVLGESAYDAFLEAKIAENKLAAAQVSQWALARYANKF